MLISWQLVCPSYLHSRATSGYKAMSREGSAGRKSLSRLSCGCQTWCWVLRDIVLRREGAKCRSCIAVHVWPARFSRSVVSCSHAASSTTIQHLSRLLTRGTLKKIFKYCNKTTEHKFISFYVETIVHLYSAFR